MITTAFLLFGIKDVTHDPDEWQKFWEDIEEESYSPLKSSIDIRDTNQ